MDGTTQIGIRAVFALIILLVASRGSWRRKYIRCILSSVVVSLLNPDEEMVEKLDSFGYGFFIPIFLYNGWCRFKHTFIN